jgi:Regulator of ribonuclease activity B
MRTDSFPPTWCSNLRVLACVLVAFTLEAQAQVAMPDSFKFLATHNLFERIKSDPGFNLEQESTFGYFFSSKDQPLLRQLRIKLESDGYVFVSHHEASDGISVLQMARIEIHTVDSLVDRNRKLFALATSLGAVSYTGWDITRNSK